MLKNLIWITRWYLYKIFYIKLLIFGKKYQLKNISYFSHNKKIIYKKQNVKIYAPIFYSSDDDTKIKINKNKVKYYFPEIYITDIENSTVTGGSSLIIKDNFLVHHNFFDFKTDIFLDEIKGNLFIYKNKKDCLFINKKIKKKIKIAAFFLDSVSFNYAHWITEILPKIFIFCTNKKYKKIPLLIDKNLKPNQIESLKYVVGKRKIIFVKKNEKIYVEKLFAISNCGYHPIRTNTNINKPEGYFNQQLLSDLKNYLKEKIINHNSKKYNNLFLIRRSNFRNIKNQIKIQNLYQEQNYKTLVTGNKSFKDQFTYFYHAKKIVGVSGADFANLIFCKNNKTKILMFARFIPNMHGLYYWSSLYPKPYKKIKIVLGHCNNRFQYLLSKFAQHRNFSISNRLLNKKII